MQEGGRERETEMERERDRESCPICYTDQTVFGKTPETTKWCYPGVLLPLNPELLF